MAKFRIGQGYDVHRLVEGRKLILGGVEIPYEKGLLGHSDADVLTHAVMDAMLGALARHVVTPSPDFQPMNANFGILDPMNVRIKAKKERYERLSQRALEKMDSIIAEYGIHTPECVL